MIHDYIIKGSPPNLIGVALGGHHSLTVHIILCLIVQDAEAAHSRVCIRVGPVLASLISPVFRNHDFVDRPQDIHLELAVSFGSCGETGRGIDLDEPGLAVIVDQHIEAIELETVLVVDDHTLHTFQRHYDDIVDVLKAAVRLLGAVDHL